MSLNRLCLTCARTITSTNASSRLLRSSMPQMPARMMSVASDAPATPPPPRSSSSAVPPPPLPPTPGLPTWSDASKAEMAARQSKIRWKNAALGFALAGGVVGIWYYSVWAVSEQRESWGSTLMQEIEAELEQEEKNKAAQQEQK